MRLLTCKQLVYDIRHPCMFPVSEQKSCGVCVQYYPFSGIEKTKFPSQSQVIVLRSTEGYKNPLTKAIIDKEIE